MKIKKYNPTSPGLRHRLIIQKNLLALDNSQEMLEKCKNTISSGKCEGVKFMLGDTSIALAKNIKSDLLILNMVLHHIPTPAKTF